MHPISNGICERANRSVLTLIRKTIESNDQWGELCPFLEYLTGSILFSTGVIVYNIR